MTHHRIIRPVRSLAAWMLFAISLSAFLAMIPAPQPFALEAGFGGQTGEVLKSAVLAVLNLGFKGFFASLVATALFGSTCVMAGAAAAGFSRGEHGASSSSNSLIARLYRIERGGASRRRRGDPDTRQRPARRSRAWPNRG